MSLVKYNGKTPVFSHMLENFFDRDMNDLLTNHWPFTNIRIGANLPAVNIREADNNFQLEIAVPGMKKEDFQVTLDNGLLTISSEKEETNESGDEEGRYSRREFSYHAFRRSFRLPDTADTDHIQAAYTDGILHLTVPKKEEAKTKAPKQISIS